MTAYQITFKIVYIMDCLTNYLSSDFIVGIRTYIRPLNSFEIPTMSRNNYISFECNPPSFIEHDELVVIHVSSSL